MRHCDSTYRQTLTTATFALFAFSWGIASAEWQMIDNFDNRNLGLLNEQGRWVVNEFGSLGVDADEVVTDPTNPANQVMAAIGTVGEAVAVEDGY